PNAKAKNSSKNHHPIYQESAYLSKEETRVYLKPWFYLIHS
ncbi:MAG: hypothetical protein ACI9QN_002356, partial [Arcticibacterium sp.]